VAILGPRQCGKTTLARHLVGNLPEVLYLDLERPSDISRLADPEALFAANASRMICIDEIQRVPELFSVMRYAIDADRRPGRFLILGSASKELIRQSSETLAGRIRYLELGFLSVGLRRTKSPVLSGGSILSVIFWSAIFRCCSLGFRLNGSGGSGPCLPTFTGNF